MYVHMHMHIHASLFHMYSSVPAQPLPLQCSSEGDGATECGCRERRGPPVHGAARDGHVENIRAAVQQDQGHGGQQRSALPSVPGLAC